MSQSSAQGAPVAKAVAAHGVLHRGGPSWAAGAELDRGQKVPEHSAPGVP